MKSDIEILLESQVWKRASPNLKKSKTLEKGPFKLRPLVEKPQLHSKNQSSVDSQFHLQEHIKQTTQASSPNSFLPSGIISPLQVPTFPKLPFGIHSQMLKKNPIFKEINVNSEQLKQFKIENGRIRRAIQEGHSRYSPKNSIIQSIRLTLKNCY